MKRAPLLLLVSLVACGKASNRRGDDEPAPPDKTKPPPAKVVTDPACLAKTKAFATWSAALAREAASYEVDFGYQLAVAPRPPSPVPQRGDAVEITAKRIAGWDSTESNHIGSTSAIGDAPDDAKLAAGLKDMRAKLSPASGYDHVEDDRLRLDIDKDAPWLSIVRVVTAAKAAGYAKAVIALTATSEVEQPPGVEPWTMDEKVTDAARAKLEELGKKCAVDSADGLAACNCAVDPDEVKKLVWQSTRWHQAKPRTSITILLGDSGIVSQASPVTWATALPAVLAAVPDATTPVAVSFQLAKR